LRGASVSRDVDLRGLLVSFRVLGSWPGLLAASEEVRVLPLVGFARWYPFTVRLPTRPLPEARASFGPAVRPAGSRSALVVSHHLGGLLRVGSAGLLRPAAGLGVRRVSRRLSDVPEGRRIGVPFPASRIHPTKSSPRQQPFPHRCVRCLRVVAVRAGGGAICLARCQARRSAPSDGSADFEALLR
jgi:hypothetical protein